MSCDKETVYLVANFEVSEGGLGGLGSTLADSGIMLEVGEAKS